MGGLPRHWHVSLFAAARQCGPQSEVKQTCRRHRRADANDPCATFGLEQVPQSLPSDPS
jgi:hypothetical protein